MLEGPDAQRFVGVVRLPCYGLTLRTGVRTDQHFATDVITGWGFGVIFGFVLPSVYDYSRPAEASVPKLSLRNLTPFLGPEARGVQYTIRF